MIYPYEFLAEAFEEASEAIQFIEGRRSGYGKLFSDLLDQTVELIRRDPLRFQQVSGRPKIRKLNLPKPFNKTYTVYYQFDGHRVIILSVFHNRRHPGVWENR